MTAEVYDMELSLVEGSLIDGTIEGDLNVSTNVEVSRHSDKVTCDSCPRSFPKAQEMSSKYAIRYCLRMIENHSYHLQTYQVII